MYSATLIGKFWKLMVFSLVKLKLYSSRPIFDLVVDMVYFSGLILLAEESENAFIITEIENV